MYYNQKAPKLRIISYLCTCLYVPEPEWYRPDASGIGSVLVWFWHSCFPKDYSQETKQMLPASIGPVQAQLRHIHGLFTKIRFTSTYLMTYPAKIISFNNDIFDKHLHIQLMIRITTCLNTLPTLDGLSVILIFHYWPWKCIESHWLHVTLVLVPQEHFEWYFFFIQANADQTWNCRWC